MRSLAAVLVFVAVLRAAAEPRPIHEAEREAVAIVAAFLARGPDALWTRLAADAPLRALPKEDALAELAARTGPSAGATWTLQTSEGNRDAAFQVTWPNGTSDGLLFRMQHGGGGWMLHDVVTLAEMPEKPADQPAAPTRPVPFPLITMALVFALIGLGIRGRSRLTSAAALALGAAFAAAAAYSWTRDAERPAPSFVELRALAPLRDALARGTDAGIPSGISREARNVAKLWLLQSGATVNVALRSIGGTPLAELVRARIALNAGKEEEAARAFERAAAVKPVRDDVLHEAAFSLTGKRSDAFLARMRNLGSRDAETYYREKSYEAFRTAWMLDPKPREELVRDDLLTDLRTKSLVSYYSALEPVRRSTHLAASPASWPSAAKAFVSGERLRVEIGDAALEVPNGAALAPRRDVQLVSATHGERRRDAAALRDARELLENGGSASRTRLIRAAIALGRHNRWADVLALTEGEVPPELLEMRIRALLRARRVEDAVALAEHEDVRTLDDPDALVAIAEALSNAGQWSTAETLFRSVKSAKHAELVALRLRQVELRRALATSSQTIATEHFDVRHDPSINPAIATRIGELLEAELARLRRKLPPVELRRVAVNVLRWEDFRGEFTRSDHILGLYDGEILFPFAAVAQFNPEVVAVITHELTHAILAQATADNAPRWFQEGVAARMELVDRQENAFSRTAPTLVLPVTLLDAVMEKNSDPAAYVVAQTFIRFLEDTYGERAIATLAAELARGGASTDDALTRLTGKSLDALNAEFRQWGFHHNGDFMRSEPWPYAHFHSPDVDPRIKAGFQFKRP